MSKEYELIASLREIAKYVCSPPFFPPGYFKVVAAADEYLASHSQEQEKAPIYNDEIPHR